VTERIIRVYAAPEQMSQKYLYLAFIG
jgi:hypothetical protein